MTVRYMTIAVFAEASGYTKKAIRIKIERGVWQEGRQFRKAPDGHILIDTQGVERWVEGRQAA